jgi:endo-1,4-beta-xylanase
LKLIEKLKKSDVPLDGIGLQAHLDLRKGSISQPLIASFLDELKAFGLFIFVTELDVTEKDFFRPVEERDAEVANEVSKYLDVIKDYPDLRGVSTWGITDRYSWLGLSPEEIEHYEKLGYWRDGSSPGVNRGLPLDASLRPKPFFDTLKSHNVAAG